MQSFRSQYYSYEDTILPAKSRRAAEACKGKDIKRNSVLNVCSSEDSVKILLAHELGQFNAGCFGKFGFDLK